MTTTFRSAIRDALDEALADDERVILFGEDVGKFGGGVTGHRGNLPAMR